MNPETMCQLITLGMCLESRTRLAKTKPGDFLEGEIGAVIHELQQLMANPEFSTMRLDQFLVSCGVTRDGRISDSIAAQVVLDSQAKRLLDKVRKLSAGYLGTAKASWIQEVKKLIGGE